MPCNDWGRGSEESVAELNVENAQLRKRNDKLVRMLCELCGLTDSSDRFSGASPELKAWWIEHQKLDFAEKQREFLKFAASKLSLQELEAIKRNKGL